MHDDYRKILNSADLVTDDGCNSLFVRISDIHQRIGRASEPREVVTFLNAVHGLLDGTLLEPRHRQLVLSIFGYWAIAKPDLWADGEIQIPSIGVRLTPVTATGNGIDLITAAISDEFPPAHLALARKILSEYKFDPTLLRDRTIMTNALWRSVRRFVHRAASPQFRGFRNSHSTSLIGTYYPYTSIDSGFATFRNALENIQADYFSRTRTIQSRDIEMNLSDAFEDATLSSQPVLFHFLQFIYGEPRVTNVSYIQIGWQHLMCLAIRRDAAVFQVDNLGPQPRDPISRLTDFLESCRCKNEILDIPPSQITGDDFLLLCEQTVEPASALLRQALERAAAADKRGGLRCHRGFIFDQLALNSAAMAKKFDYQKEKTLIAPIDVPPSDDTKLVELMQASGNRNTVWALDPWYYYRLAPTAVKNTHRLMMVGHGGRVPVGIGFTDLLLPQFLGSEELFTATRHAGLTALRPFESSLRAIGISLGPDLPGCNYRAHDEAFSNEENYVQRHC